MMERLLVGGTRVSTVLCVNCAWLWFGVMLILTRPFWMSGRPLMQPLRKRMRCDHEVYVWNGGSQMGAA